MDKRNNSNPAPAENKGGFLQNIFSNLFKSNTPEAEKKRKLKAIAKEFSKTKYHGYFKPASGELTAQFAKLFYDIYKIIYPAQNMLRAMQNKNQFKGMILNFSLSENQLQLLEHLNEDKINEMAGKIQIKDIKAKIEADMDSFSAQFDAERTARVENMYKAYLSFYDFCTFDYYFMLKKFGVSFQEGTFTSTPPFEKANAEYLIEDLQDFITIIYSIPEDILWDPFFAMIKETRGSDLVPAGTWKKIMARMKAIQSSQAFEMIVRLTTKNPKYDAKIVNHSEEIVDAYIDKIREEVTSAVAALEAQQKNSRASSLCEQIFGTNDIDALKYYTTSASDALEKKELASFEFADSLNYLKAFLLEFVKSDLREYHDIVVIRGQWSASLAAPFSNAYQELMSTSDQITAFDDQLAEEGPIGIKIKTLLPKIAHDPGAENIIKRLVSDANETAKGFILQSTQNLITIGKQIKQLIEDYSKSKPVIVSNWKELERYSERPLKDFSVEVYKKIYTFVQLMQTCIQG